MKKEIFLLIISLFVLSTISSAQGYKRFHQVITQYDSIKNIDDWMRKNINVSVISATKNTDSDLKNNRSNTNSNSEWYHETYSLNYKNIPLEYSSIKIHKYNGLINSINGEYCTSIDTNTTPVISESTALNFAKSNINATKYIWEANETEFLNNTNQQYLSNLPVGKLVYCKDYNDTIKDTLCLSWKFEIYAVSPIYRGYVYVNAMNGKIIHTNSIIKHAQGTANTRYAGTKNITTTYSSNVYTLKDNSGQRGNGIETYNMNSTTSYSSAVNFQDNDNNWSTGEFDNTSKDNAALDAHWGAMQTYDYYKQIHNRNSFDDNGSAIKNYVHYNTSYENAFWDGAVMSYGDGATDFDALTSLDIVAHEITHGVTERTANLVYQGESGALNESVSDIIASCVESKVSGATFMDIWTVGEDIDKRPNQSGMRHMWHPILSNQPNTYFGVNWHTGTDDNGGVHTNSGVFNFWFYLLSMGGSGTNNNGTTYSVTGIGINKSEQIIYTALTKYFTPNTNFLTASLETIFATQEVFGFCSDEVISVKNAWKAVGANISLQIPTDLTITQTITTGTTTVKSALNNINASNVIETNTNVTYRAGNLIELEPGFETQTGANFDAYIEPCSPNFSSQQNRIASSQTNINQNHFDTLSIVNEKSNQELKLNPKNNEILIFPNPTSNTISLNCKTKISNASITIYEISGQLVSHQTLDISNTTLDLTPYPKGVYTIQILSNSLNKYYKIIKN